MIVCVWNAVDGLLNKTKTIESFIIFMAFRMIQKPSSLSKMLSILLEPITMEAKGSEIDSSLELLNRLDKINKELDKLDFIGFPYYMLLILLFNMDGYW